MCWQCCSVGSDHEYWPPLETPSLGCLSLLCPGQGAHRLVTLCWLHLVHQQLTKVLKTRSGCDVVLHIFQSIRLCKVLVR